MNRSALRVVIGALLALALSATAANAAKYIPSYPDQPDLVFTEQETWLHKATTPLGNVDARQGAFLKWDTTKPTASAPLGAGGASVANNYSTFTESAGVGREWNTFTTKGTFTGELDTMAITLYQHKPAGALCDSANLSFDLRIDGVEILLQEQSAPSAGIAMAAESDTLYKVPFVLTKIHKAMQTYDIATGPDVTHEIYLNVANFYACDEAVWVYDSAEAPAGIVFNRVGKALGPYTEIDVLNPPPPLETSTR